MSYNIDSFIKECKLLQSDDIVIDENNRWVSFEEFMTTLLNLDKRKRKHSHIKAICTNKKLDYSKGNHAEQLLLFAALRSHSAVISFLIKRNMLSFGSINTAINKCSENKMYEHLACIFKENPSYIERGCLNTDDFEKIFDLTTNDDVPILPTGYRYSNLIGSYIKKGDTKKIRHLILDDKFETINGRGYIIITMLSNNIEESIIELFLRRLSVKNKDFASMKDLLKDHGYHKLWQTALCLPHVNEDYSKSITILNGFKDVNSILSYLPLEILSVIINNIQ